ncbi:MAG: hypothetical protein U5Q16_12470 [Gammaproteobacteria bacterium]|nr:hypothetical protein [Gammaproteobacteria bacterium]
MDWNRYKALCDTPDVCSRWLLEQTRELLDEPSLKFRLNDGLSAQPVPKPDDHEGDAATDMFQMDLSLPEVRALRRQIEAAAAEGRTSSGTRGRGLGGFVEAWLEYERYLEQRADNDQ